MKKISLPIRLLILSIIFFISSFNLNAQNFSVGGFFGGGVIKSNSPNEGSFTSSLFVDFGPPLSSVTYRLSFLYAGYFAMLVPGSTNRYFPFVRGISIKATTSQPVNNLVYIEEAAGLLTLNDRIFEGANEWDYGVVFSLLGGLDLRNNSPTGFKIGAGTEFGLTFNNSNAEYFSLHFQVQYVF